MDDHDAKPRKASQTASDSFETLQWLLVNHRLAHSTHDPKKGLIATAGNLAVTGGEAHLTHSMLLDLASLSLSLLPPKGLFVKRNTGTAAYANSPARDQQSADPRGQATIPKLALQVTRVTVGVTSMVVGYQTAVEVAAAERRQEQDGALTVRCTQCMTLQELTAEVYPLLYRGSLQMNNLTVTHQETQGGSPPAMPLSGQAGHLQHEIDILRAAHLSVQAEALPQHANTLPASHSIAADHSASVDNVDQDSEQLGPPRLAVKVALNAWRTVFHADAVIGLCKAAADVSSVVHQTGASLQIISLASVEVNSKAAKVPAVGPAEATIAPARGDDTSLIMAKLSKLQSLPGARLTVEIAKWQTDVIVADHIVWSARLAEVQLKLDSRILLGLQQQQLQAQLAQLPQQTQAHPAEQAHQAELAILTHPIKQKQQHSRGMTEAYSLKELLAASERPSLVATEICLTLNKKALLHCGQIDGSLNLCPRHENQPSISRAFSSSTSPGSPRRQASLGKMVFHPPPPTPPPQLLCSLSVSQNAFAIWSTSDLLRCFPATVLAIPTGVVL